jgi:3-oxosteroid 1-dehydrogenase
VVVNTLGKRISNESQNYMSFMKEAFEKHSQATPSSPMYMIFDSNFRKKYFVGPLLNAKFRPDFMLPQSYYDEGFLAKADNIPDLARKMKIDVDALVDTVKRMNEYAKTGKDPELHRGDALYDRYYGDPEVKPNPCLGPIVQAPFYAIRMDLGDFGTNGGLVIDTNAQVHDEAGNAIPGLYAIGNTAAGMLVTYPGPGSTLGPAMAFAYRAAKHIAAG